MNKEYEELLEASENEFIELNKMLIESSAINAYNSVIFESAMEDDVLMEADSKEKDPDAPAPHLVKNAAYKAFETFKRMATQVLEKIRAAINKWIANASNSAVTKAITNYKKSGSAGNNIVRLNKDLKLDNAQEVFKIYLNSYKGIAKEDESAFAKAVAASFAEQLPANFQKAIDALNKVTTFAELNKIYTNIVSYADEKEIVKNVREFVNEYGIDFTKASGELKANYKFTTGQVKEAISGLKNSLNDKNDAEQADAKKAISNYSKLLSTVNASYVGFMKYIVAVNMQAVKAIKSKESVDKDASMSESAVFMGLALL